MLGVSRRSGTNYLGSLLLCHRDCAAPAAPVAEDHLLREAPTLERYVRRTSRRWPRRWGDRESAADDLRRAVGSGLLTFLEDRSDGRRTVSRTPSTANLHVARRWYRRADVILLVRDGRSVAASFAAAWNWPLEWAAREWRSGARRTLALDTDGPTPARSDDAARFTVVRFEDLIGDRDTTLARLLDFAGLDPGRFDHAAADRLPVLGSSYTRDERGRITWEPRPASAGFDPTRRDTDWTPAQRRRFEWIAGDEQRAFGYAAEVDAPTGPPAVARMLALDATMAVRHAPWLAGRALRSSLRDARAEIRARRSPQGSTLSEDGAISSISPSIAERDAATR